MDRAPPPFVDMSAKSRFLIDAFSRYFPNYANNQGYLVEVSLKLDYTRSFDSILLYRLYPHSLK